MVLKAPLGSPLTKYSTSLAARCFAAGSTLAVAATAACSPSLLLADDCGWAADGLLSCSSDHPGCQADWPNADASPFVSRASRSAKPPRATGTVILTLAATVGTLPTLAAPLGILRTLGTSNLSSGMGAGVKLTGTCCFLSVAQAAPKPWGLALYSM